MEIPEVPPGGCDDCFAPEDEDGYLPPERVDDLDAYLTATTPEIGGVEVSDRDELCTAIENADV